MLNSRWRRWKCSMPRRKLKKRSFRGYLDEIGRCSRWEAGRCEWYRAGITGGQTPGSGLSKWRASVHAEGLCRGPRSPGRSSEKWCYRCASGTAAYVGIRRAAPCSLRQGWTGSSKWQTDTPIRRRCPAPARTVVEPKWEVHAGALESAFEKAKAADARGSRLPSLSLAEMDISDGRNAAALERLGPVVAADPMNVSGLLV